MPPFSCNVHSSLIYTRSIRQLIKVTLMNLRKQCPIYLMRCKRLNSTDKGPHKRDADCKLLLFCQYMCDDADCGLDGAGTGKREGMLPPTHDVSPKAITVCHVVLNQLWHSRYQPYLAFRNRLVMSNKRQRSITMHALNSASGLQLLSHCPSVLICISSWPFLVLSNINPSTQQISR